tara:strand:+ start:74 stop:892 length:819 start_codon:yes stop_codon:yes gene_type:complete
MKTVSNKYNFLKPVLCDDLTRLGNNFDGGYIVSKKIIKNSKILISFGYSYEPSFEYDYIKHTSGQVYIYDYSCSSFKLIGRFLESLLKFIFRTNRKKKGPKFYFQSLIEHLSFTRNSRVNFYQKKIIGNFSVNNSNFFESTSTIENIFEKIKYDKVILKCDIEGSEYEIIDDFLNYHDKIDLAVIEFHNLEKDLKRFTDGVKKILKYFSIVHIHGNNYNSLLKDVNLPSVPEITFISNRLIKEQKSGNKKFPIELLDYPNNLSEKDLFFNFM